MGTLLITTALFILLAATAGARLVAAYFWGSFDGENRIEQEIQIADVFGLFGVDDDLADPSVLFAGRLQLLLALLGLHPELGRVFVGSQPGWFLSIKDLVHFHTPYLGSHVSTSFLVHSSVHHKRCYLFMVKSLSEEKGNLRSYFSFSRVACRFNMLA